MPDTRKATGTSQAAVRRGDALARGQAVLARWAGPGAREALAGALAITGTAEALEGLGWACYRLDEAEPLCARRGRACRAYLTP
jgi:hypothetical protein